MNVTLILGNGFDLNMGLPTSYSDFYQYYLKVDSPIQADFIKQKIKDEPKTWADFKDYLAKTLVSDNSSQQAELMNKIYPIRNNHMFNFGFTQKDRDVVRREVIHKLVTPHFVLK